MKAEHLSQIQAAVAAVKERKTIRRFYFVACGGSQASMMPIQYMFDRETSIPSAIYTSNEFVKATPKVLDDTCVVLTISHSGNTPETVRAAELAKEKGAVSISLTNLVDSPLWKACEYPIHYEHGPEADPNDLSKVILYTLAFDMLNVVEPSEKWVKGAESLNNLAEVTERIKAKYADFGSQWGKDYKRETVIYTMGSGANYGEMYSLAICLFMEMQWIHSNCIHSGEYFHGPFEVTDFDVPFVLVKGIGATRELDERAYNFCSKFSQKLAVIDEAEFDYLNETLNNAVNKQDFLSGKVAVLQYSGFEIPENSLDKPIQFSFGNNTQEIEIGAISYTDYYGGSFNIGANLIVSEEYLNSLVERPYILSLLIKYEQMYDENTENEVKSLIQESNYSNDLSYTSIYDEMKTIQDSQGNMLEIGTVIALLLLLIGMLNYINTMASNMQNRKLTFSIMESVGMSRKQIRKLLIREGLLYAFGSIFITLTVGTGITYVVFQSMNYMEIPFSVPILPLLCAIILVTIICVATLLFSYNRTAGSKSIVERLREYE